MRTIITTPIVRKTTGARCNRATNACGRHGSKYDATYAYRRAFWVSVAIRPEYFRLCWYPTTRPGLLVISNVSAGVTALNLSTGWQRIANNH